MKALILAAGLGTRLGEVTRTTPKALVKVGSNSILDHNIRKLLDAGIREILVNTHHLAEQIERFIKEQPYRQNVTTIFEPELLGTAATVKANWDYFEDSDLLIMHGDNYFEADLDQFLKAHIIRTIGTVMTMATFLTTSPESCGTIKTNESDVVIEFLEKDIKSPSCRANAAIYIFAPNAREFFFTLAPEEIDISLNLIPKLLGKIQAYSLPGEFIDIGTSQGLAKAQKIHTRIPSKS